MSLNPYQAPSADVLSSDLQSGPPRNRMVVVLAAIGAGLASVYWTVLTLLIGVGVRMGSGSAFQVVLPIVLIVLYAQRGYQIFKGNPVAARRILWLHAMGGLMAILAVAGGSSGSGILMALQSFKVVIHIFGGVTAFLAMRALGGNAPQTNVR